MEPIYSQGQDSSLGVQHISDIMQSATNSSKCPTQRPHKRSKLILWLDSKPRARLVGLESNQRVRTESIPANFKKTARMLSTDAPNLTGLIFNTSLKRLSRKRTHDICLQICTAPVLYGSFLCTLLAFQYSVSQNTAT